MPAQKNIIYTAASGKKQQRPLIFIQHVYSSVDSITLIKQLRQQQKCIIFIKLACFMLSRSLVFRDSSLSIIHNQKTANHSKLYHMISCRNKSAALMSSVGFYTLRLLHWSNLSHRLKSNQRKSPDMLQVFPSFEHNCKETCAWHSTSKI